MIAQSLIDSGSVDVLELGIPFSDPIADGPVIQAAVERSLNAGMNTDIAFELTGNLDKKIPVVYLTYYNIVLQYGIERFIKSCSLNGISGLIIADLPFEESEDVREYCERYNVSYINIVTPNTSAERMEMILNGGKGFVYVVSTMGVTGIRKTVPEGLKSTVDNAIKSAKGTPVAVGFGISGEDQVRSIIQMGANGAIVGSAIVDIIGKNGSVESILGFVEKLKAGTRPLKTIIVKQ
jgi:tryptophan synthase alpha chain